jgi:hypothetical protein
VISRARSAVAVVITLVAGCGPGLYTIDRGVHFDRTSPDAVVVFGFSTRLNVWIVEGNSGTMDWSCSHPINDVLARGVWRVRPENGFAVARLPARTGKQSYGIVAVGTDNNLAVYAAKMNTNVWVFHAKPGQVNYLGALRVASLSDDGPKIVTDDSVTEEEAEHFMDQAYPKWTAPLEAGRLDGFYMGSCGARSQ